MSASDPEVEWRRSIRGQINRAYYAYKAGALLLCWLHYIALYGPIALSLTAFALLSVGHTASSWGMDANLTSMMLTLVGAMLSTVSAFAKLKQRWLAEREVEYQLKSLRIDSGSPGILPSYLAEELKAILEEDRVRYANVH